MLFRSDRKSTRLNSSHTLISYAVFCLKKKKSIARAPALADVCLHYQAGLASSRVVCWSALPADRALSAYLLFCSARAPDRASVLRLHPVRLVLSRFFSHADVRA